MRERYGWWLFGVSLLVTSAAGSLLFIASSRPSPKAVDLLDRLQIGMDLEDTLRVMGWWDGTLRQKDPEVWFEGGAGGSFSQNYSFTVEEDWQINVSFDREGKLNDKSLFRVQNTPWYRRAWQSLRKKIHF
jgi:hypothetical protein